MCGFGKGRGGHTDVVKIGSGAVRLRAADGLRVSRRAVLSVFVEKPTAWFGIRAPGAEEEELDEKPRPPPPDPRPHLSIGLSRNFELGNDAINRLAYVAERSKYRLGVECSSDLYGDEAGLMLAGLPAKDRRFVIVQ